MVAAYEIASSPKGSEFDIDVYQIGWRLGGKGASGRNEAEGFRIEEHGAHVWFGFYENAFNVLRRAINDAVSVAPAARTLEESFKPDFDFTFMERNDEGAWLTDWYLRAPTFADGFPGNDREDITLESLCNRILPTLIAFARDYISGHGQNGGSQEQPASSPLIHALFRALRRMEGECDTRDLRNCSLDTLISLKESFNWILEQLPLTDSLRRFWILFDIGMTIAIGVIRDDVLIRGFDHLNELDFHEWLELHGLSSLACWSGPLRFIYDVIFAYEQGDMERPNVAAGAALRGALRLVFDYRAAPYYLMNGGMGDIVFAPLYLALRHRYNVRFHFFREILDIEYGNVKNSKGVRERIITKVKIQPQAQLRDGIDEYSPLRCLPSDGTPYWPSVPDHTQLQHGEYLRDLVNEGLRLEFPRIGRPRDDDSKPCTLYQKWLERTGLRPEYLTLGDRSKESGRGFETIILGISLGALKHITPSLQKVPQWLNMVTKVPTVGTQAFQLWLTLDRESLGWDEPNRNPMVTSFTEPYSTWTDFSHTIDGSSPKDVKSIAYFFGPLDETSEANDLPHKERAHQWCLRSLPVLWPKMFAADGERLNYSKLACNAKRNDGPNDPRQRFDAQWFEHNDIGSGRYVQSCTSTIQYRLDSCNSGFSNLYLAGDWTNTGLDVGCVESAAMSGREVARVLGGQPVWVHGRALGETQ